MLNWLRQWIANDLIDAAYKRGRHDGILKQREREERFDPLSVAMSRTSQIDLRYGLPNIVGSGFYVRSIHGAFLMETGDFGNKWTSDREQAKVCFLVLLMQTLFVGRSHTQLSKAVRFWRA